jgi:hypothetical protein
MDEYLIGTGALVTAGEHPCIIPAALHAAVEAAVAAAARVAVVDFDGASARVPRRLLLLVRDWRARAFEASVIARLRSKGLGSCTEALAALAEGTKAGELHLFARWLPGEDLCEGLAGLGVTIVAHPLEAIHRACLIEQRGCGCGAVRVRAA